MSSTCCRSGRARVLRRVGATEVPPNILILILIRPDMPRNAGAGLTDRCRAVASGMTRAGEGRTVFHAINLPLMGDLAEPAAVVDIAVAAEENGFDGLFVWDHVLSPVSDIPAVADAWLVLAAVAARTGRMRLGPMVTPLPRRRIGKLARETVTLDRLSLGRLTLGLGAGGDRHGEFSRFGEPPGNAQARAVILDEGMDVLVALWSGQEVCHDDRVVVDGVAMTPRPLQQPRIPIWVGARGYHQGAAKRAARFEGIFPLDVTGDEVRRYLDLIADIRGSRDGFDLALAVHQKVRLEDLRRQGATWAMHSFWPGHRPDQVLRFVCRGRPE